MINNFIIQQVFCCATAILAWLSILWYLFTKTPSSVMLISSIATEHRNTRYKSIAKKVQKDKVRHKGGGRSRDRTQKTKRTIPKLNKSPMTINSRHQKNPPVFKPKDVERIRHRIVFRARDRTHKVIFSAVPVLHRRTQRVQSIISFIIGQGLFLRNTVANDISIIIQHTKTCVDEFISNRVVYRKLFVSIVIVGLLFLNSVSVDRDYASFGENVIMLLAALFL